jgi:hypothetical protein
VIQIDIISIEILLGVEKQFVKGHKFEKPHFHSSLLRNWLNKFEFLTIHMITYGI